MSLVQGTNDSSIISKYSMIMTGYDKDPYINYFVSRSHRRAPLINLVYYVRWLSMSRLVTHFCMTNRDLLVQIISLGAGFDTTFFRLVSQYCNIRYYEIDLPGVVKKKVEIIRNIKDLLDEIAINKEHIIYGDDNESLHSYKYTIFSHDLSCLDGLETKLAGYGFEFGAPTLVFSECALTYLEEEKSTALIRWVQRKFTRSVFAMYEQINPDDAFGYVMTTHFKRIQNPLKSIHKYKSINHQVQRFLSCGWQWCKGTTSNDLLLETNVGRIWSTVDREPFDEFEEWHLANLHYALIVATQQEYEETWKEWMPSLLQVHDSRLSVKVITSMGLGNYFAMKCLMSRPALDPVLEWYILPNMIVERFGHLCLSINDDRFLVIGGFGVEDKKHARQASAYHVSIPDSCVEAVPILQAQNRMEASPRWDCMYSTCTKVCDNKFIIYGGRLSPSKPVNNKPWLCEFQWSEQNQVGSIVPIIQGPTEDCPEPCPRWRHTAASISPGKIIVFGGFIEQSSPSRVLDDTWLLTVTNVDNEPRIIWSALPCLILHGTFSHSAAVHDDDEAMYISGGLDRDLRPSEKLFVFKLSEGWEEIVTFPMLKPRYGHTSHVTVNKQLLLVGGVNTSPTDQPGLTVISLQNYHVIEYDLSPNSPDYPVLMLHNHRSIYRKANNSIYIAGGGGNCFSFGTYFNRTLVQMHITLAECDNLAMEIDESIKLSGFKIKIQSYREALMNNL